MKKLGLYIHIPFCMNKCFYCDFATMPYQDKRIPEYFDLLEKEIYMYRDLAKDFEIDSIYIGGGTPTYVDSKYIERIFKVIYSLFNIKDDIEITIEGNPKTIDEDKIKTYKKIGINRISLGVQSFNDNLVKDLGRNHTKEDVIKDIDLLREYNFKNINLDLIFSLPNQNFEDIKNDIEYLKLLNPEHISWYSLIIEENTKFNRLYKEGLIKPMEDDLERELYLYIIKELEKIGLYHYEISNFSKENHQSYHNKKYWNCDNYLGIGLNAAGYINDTRYVNYSNWKKYRNEIIENKFPISSKEILSEKDSLFEYIIMRLRLKEGLDLNYIKEKYNYDFYTNNKDLIESYINNGLIERDINRLRFTSKGFYISNNFFVNMKIK